MEPPAVKKGEAAVSWNAASQSKHQNLGEDTLASGFTQAEARIAQLLCIAVRELMAIRAELKRLADQREIELGFWKRS
jgi:hypothetical protein